MLENARRRLDLLIGRRTDFEPPRPPTPDEAPSLREALAAWHAQAEARYARIFLFGKPLFLKRGERELFARLAKHGLVESLGAQVVQPCVRLFPLYGRFIATDLLTREEEDQVFSLMFEQVYFVRNFDVRPKDRVLELCLGSGVNSLFAADVAAEVSAVDVSPRALAFTRFNESLCPAARPLNTHVGSLFEPLAADARFDTILINPPFELVPEGETWFLHSHGGEDGLDVMRAMLKDTPARLTEAGRLQVITWTPAIEGVPTLVDAVREALPSHRVSVHLLDEAPIDAHLDPFKASEHFPAFRERLRERGLDTVQFVYLHTAPSAAPGVEVTRPTAEVADCHAISDAWIPPA